MIALIDFILLPFYWGLLYVFARIIVNRNIADRPEYRYYIVGLNLKLLGGIGLCLVYTLYYQGGDTTAYFESSVSLHKLMWRYPDIWWKIMTSDLKWEYFSYFDSKTGYPQYFRDPQSFSVVRYTNLLHLISLKRYIITTMLLSFITYQGVWRLYLLFVSVYPNYFKQLAYCILFVPSVFFWGSGILKDSITLMAACWITYSFHRMVILNKGYLVHSISIFIMANILITLKPYILLALVPGAILWLSFDKSSLIKNPVTRFMMFPIIIGSLIIVGILTYQSLGETLGQYSSVDKILNKAVVTQKDLKQEYYQGSTFDIGEFDNSFGGILSKFPLATTAGLFRPFIWEARNPVMAITGLENLVLLGLSAFLFFRLGPLRFFAKVRKQPILFFSILFALFFSFSVGLTTSNFGALSRYKIPAIPFFLTTLIVIYMQYVEEKGEEERVMEKQNRNRELVTA